MSRTYRSLEKGVKFCNNCNKPIYRHTVEVYQLCECPKKGKYGWEPNSTYYRYDVKAYDGNGLWYTQTNAGARKDAQKYRNTKLRQKTKQILNDRTTPYEEMVFPIKKNEVDWDIW